jgi:hypothetical protein
LRRSPKTECRDKDEESDQARWSWHPV